VLVVVALSVRGRFGGDPMRHKRLVVATLATTRRQPAVRAALVGIGMALVLVSCSSSGTSGSGAGTMQTTATSTSTAPLVGVWETNRTCQGLVRALAKVNLEPLAPSVVGDYFPGVDPKVLANKKNICDGATPQAHSHFFSTLGTFGSLDQHGDQVDNAEYRILNDHTVRISKVTFHYKIDGNELTLVPVITQALRHHALAHPVTFTSDAAWAVAVSYLGHMWHRVACQQWCSY